VDNVGVVRPFDGRLAAASSEPGRRTTKTMVASPSGPRFLQLADVAEVLNISASQVYALVRNGDIEAVKIGGRGQWRVEASKLEDYIARLYKDTRTFVETHPLGRDAEPPELD
jgi:excisionase family DNA binding protein